MTVNWHCKTFNKLTLNEFYDIAAARIAIFVIEQNCPYQDLDGKDKVAHHLYAINDKKEILAYARILPPNISYKEVSIGRVITTIRARGKGVGHELMKKVMEQIKLLFGDVAVRISAQEHLRYYYGTYGFEAIGEMYLEDDIPHIEMIYTKS